MRAFFVLGIVEQVLNNSVAIGFTLTDAISRKTGTGWEVVLELVTGEYVLVQYEQLPDIEPTTPGLPFPDEEKMTLSIAVLYWCWQTFFDTGKRDDAPMTPTSFMGDRHVRAWADRYHPAANWDELRARLQAAAEAPPFTWHNPRTRDDPQGATNPDSARAYAAITNASKQVDQILKSMINLRVTKQPSLDAIARIIF